MATNKNAQIAESVLAAVGGSAANIINGVISGVIAIVVAAVATYLICREPKKN